MQVSTIPVEDDLDFGVGAFPGDDLHRRFHDLREQSPVIKARFMGMECYVLTRYKTILEAFRDNERFPPEKVYQMMFEPICGRTFQTMTGKDHLQRRQLATPAFRSRAVREYDETVIGELADELLTRIESETVVDFAANFTRLFPFILISRLLGIPRDAEDRFHHWAIALLRFAEDTKRAKAANAELTAYLEPIIAARRANPEDDIISDLVTAEVDGQKFTDEEVLSHIRLIFSAGASTTHDAMGNLVYHLQVERSRWEQVRADIELRDAAVEELLRYDSPVAVLPRTAAATPVEIAGVPIPANAWVLFAIASGNRDESIFEHADDFRLDREAVPILTTFGPGPRACPGMHLARKQLTIVLSRILGRFPDLQLLDPVEAAPRGAVLRGPEMMRVRLA